MARKPDVWKFLLVDDNEPGDVAKVLKTQAGNFFNDNSIQVFPEEPEYNPNKKSLSAVIAKYPEDAFHGIVLDLDLKRG